MPSFKYREVVRSIQSKLRMDFRSGSEPNAWYILDGKQLFRVTVPHVHEGDVPPRTLNEIRKQCRLPRDDFERLVRCPMSGSDYERRIGEMKEQGLL